jgi:hypothetical protein
VRRGERSIDLVLRWKVISEYTDRGLHKLVRIYAKAQFAETLSFRVSKPHAVWPGVEQKPHVQTKLDNLLVLQSLFL